MISFLRFLVLFSYLLYKKTVHATPMGEVFPIPLTNTPSQRIDYELTTNPSASVTLLESGVIDVVTTKFNSAEDTHCALRLDRTAVCFGNLPAYSSVGLFNISKIVSSRNAHVFLRTDGVVLARGSNDGGVISGTSNINNANSGLNTDIACNIQGTCVGILEEGDRLYVWGSVDNPSASSALTNTGANIDYVVPGFRSFLVVKRDGTGETFGSTAYGNSPPSVLPLNTINIEQVLSNINGYIIKTVDGRGLSFGIQSPIHNQISTPIDEFISEPGSVSEIGSTWTSAFFLTTNGFFYSVGEIRIHTGVPNVAKIFKNQLHSTVLAVILTNGHAVAYRTNNEVFATLTDDVYDTCESSSNGILCLTTSGRVARLAGLGGYNSIPSGAQSGITKLIASYTAITAFNENTGEAFVIGAASPPNSDALVALSSDVRAIVPGYYGVIALRGYAVPPTPSPSFSPSFSPTFAPTPRQCGCSTFSPI